jgi:large subunit ribosomal protein L29
MKAREIRELGADELAQKVRETSAEIASMRMRKASGVAVDGYGKIRGMRRDVARMRTILTERERGGQK